MRYALLALIGVLPLLGLSAPPGQCDDASQSVAYPDASSDRHDVPSKDLHSPVALQSRRQRFQILKERVNKLKQNLECLPPATPSESGAPTLSEPHEASHESLPSEKSDPSHRPDIQLPVTPQVPVISEPLSELQPVQPPEPATRLETPPELAPAPLLESQIKSDPDPQPVSVPAMEPESVLEPERESVLEPHPEPTDEPSPEAVPVPLPEPVTEPHAEPTPPPPELPHPISKIPVSATLIPLPMPGKANPDHKDTTLALPSELLDHAIDRQRMGNNLYAIGAYELALKNYEMMLREPLDSLEAQWVHFQIANCQRHLGQFALAQKSYRRVTGETTEEWIGQTSRWWLKELDDREQLQSRVVELDQIIKTLSAEVNRDK